MKDNLTEIVFILDRSGSMSNLTNDTIGGYNSFIEKQKNQEGEAKLTTILFDDKYEILHDGINIQDVQPITNKEYCPRGMTALLDAIGKTINTVGERLNNTDENNKPSKVIFVITTDGHENVSKEFSQSKIREMIEHQKEKYNWEFLFLGANIDSVAVGNSYGILNVSNYSANSRGLESVYCSVTDEITNYRGSGKIRKNWNKDIK